MMKHYLFDWGDTLMVDLPNQTGPMCDWPEVKVVDGALDCLKRLSQRGTCNLATNAAESSESQIRLALKRVGLSEYVTHIFCRENLGVRKADPSYYPQIITKLNVSPNNVIMIGDSLERDVLPAKAAGLEAIWLNPYNLQTPKKINTIQLLSELPI